MYFLIFPLKMKIDSDRKSLIGIVINLAVILISYFWFVSIKGSITGAELTAYGAPIQWFGAMLYIIYVFSIVALIMQVIIFALKKLAIFTGLEEHN